MDRISSLTQSRLYQRISAVATASATPENTALLASVTQVVEQATWISEQVVRHMPQYTLHQKTHLFNVLRLMEELLPDETLKQLTPLECALCILAAFTHDLGMAISEEEIKETFSEESEHPNRTKYLRHWDMFSEEVRQIERLYKGTESERERAKLLEGHIRAEYLRTTHASADATRIRFWLGKIAEVANNPGLFTLNGLNFTERLAEIAASHNQNVAWLREHLCKGRHDKAFRLSDANLAFPALLLRLADYMDFDATRTPRILYRNFGIDNKVSVQEWEKHLAITHWEFLWDDMPSVLRYEAIDCTSPVFEKTIKEFVAGIEQEVRLVRDELATQVRLLGSVGKRYELRLPEKLEADVQAKVENGKALYIYRDIEFKLDQDEILQLLMGESLYGDPSLCIRELLQNSLDAVELRRLRLRQPEVERAEKTDFIEEDKLQIHVTWGKDDASGQEFIRVEDNGTGMTRRTLETYFTQIGKSFYRSPEFERERIAMRRAGLLSTPISQFGIGILSCFMLADRLEVNTCPGGKDDHDRTPYNVSISGPGSLFWLTEGTRKEQGTEITLYLKTGFALKEESLTTLLIRLKNVFGYFKSAREETEDAHAINPAFIVSSQVIWPTCPILLGQGKNAYRLDDRSHWDFLNTIDLEKLTKKAAEWGCPAEMLGQVRWETFDWVDEADAKDATGSRIRLIFPKHHDDGSKLPTNPAREQNLCRMDELLAFVESQLNTNKRSYLMVKSMKVADLKVVDRFMQVGSKVGSYLWFDLRGDASPKLTADRTKALERIDVESWNSVVQGVFTRWKQDVVKKSQRHPETDIAWRSLIRGLWDDLNFNTYVETRWDFLKLNLSWSNQAEIVLRFRCNQFVQDLALARDRDHDLNGDYDHDLNGDRDLARDLARTRDRDLARDLAPDCNLYGTRDFVLSCGLNIAFKQTYEFVIALNLFNEAFQPSLERSWQVLGLYGLKGRMGDALLTAPSAVRFEKGPDGRTVRFADPQGREPAELLPYGYDLVFPLTIIPTGTLRRWSEVWRTERAARAIGVLPFLYLGKSKVLKESHRRLSRVFFVSQIHALWPKIELWDVPFAEWTPENWENDCWTATWDIKKNIVLWAHGAHTPEEMEASVGKEFEAFAEAEQLREAAA